MLVNWLDYRRSVVKAFGLVGSVEPPASCLPVDRPTHGVSPRQVELCFLKPLAGSRQCFGHCKLHQDGIDRGWHDMVRTGILKCMGSKATTAQDLCARCENFTSAVKSNPSFTALADEACDRTSELSQDTGWLGW